MLEFLKKEIDYFGEKLSGIISKQKKSALYNSASYLFNTRGKFLRPIITLLSCQLVGGDLSQGFPGALAVELIHSASLAQDDIIDEDDYRRGRHTLFRKFGRNIAMLTSGQLFAIAFKYLSETGLVYLINEMGSVVEDMYEGEAIEISLREKDNIPLEDVLKVNQLKTARLFEFAAETGARLAGVNDKISSNLKQYGFNVGMAFQLKDDWLDIYGDHQEIGKTIGNDLLSGEKTFLYTFAYQNGLESDQKKLKKIIKSKEFDIQEIKEIFTRTGAEKELERLIKQYQDAALDCLESFPPSSYLEKLKKIVILSGERSR
ncbi:MAG: polyprenyl synthetase family protein [Candidatus Ranarchaeia archaeon]